MFNSMNNSNKATNDISLNQRTYERLKREIMTFTLMPGEPISAAKIAERYQVSRTPAREAIVKLETEGLIDIYPQSKSVVSKVDIKRANQEWFVRRSLELGMVDALFDNVTQDAIDEMKYYANQLSEVGKNRSSAEESYEYLRYDNLFHMVTYKVAKQDLASEIISNMMVHYNRIRLLNDLDDNNKNRTVADHASLIECVENNDREGYRAYLIRHLGHIISDIEIMGKIKPELFENK